MRRQNVWLNATLIAGTLDIGYAMLMTALKSKNGAQDIAPMLRQVAAGPLGDAALGWGAAGSVAGLAVHFALMAVMVGVYLLLAWFFRRSVGQANPWLAGPIYGLAVYLAMYGLVLPARFGTPFPQPDTGKLLIGLFPHLFLVGLPIALCAAKANRRMWA